MKFFNTAGPNDPARHYTLPATRRLTEENVMRLIEQHGYFVLHAPRQVGKTTTMRAFARELTASGKYVKELLLQHTSETGQVFTAEALELVFNLTEGQPWLVNALAKLCVEELVTDMNLPITEEHVERAKEILIERRQTHLGQLAHKLSEERVRRVIEPMLAGTTLDDVPRDDREYVVDLGLCRQDAGQGLVIANPIYREILPRELAGAALAALSFVKPTWLDADGSLNADRLLKSFLEFWRQHGEPLLKSASYHEIAPHLVMMAYLHRVVNGGGTLEREYAIGTDRMDLYLRYGATRLGIELKVWRDGRPDPLRRGLEQLDEYLAGLGLDTGWLVIFDRRGGQPPISERTTTESAISPGGRNVIVIRA